MQHVIRLLIAVTVIATACTAVFIDPLSAAPLTGEEADAADAAAIRAWAEHWYGEQTPDKEGYIMKMTVVYLRISGAKALVHGDYGSRRCWARVDSNA